MLLSMVIVHVAVQVKPQSIETFRAETVENSRQSLLETGIVRFDVVQSKENPAKFVLVEVYRDCTAVDAHKQTTHYQKWRDAVESMMAAPRTREIFTEIFPTAKDW